MQNDDRLVIKLSQGASVGAAVEKAQPLEKSVKATAPCVFFKGVLKRALVRSGKLYIG